MNRWIVVYLLMLNKGPSLWLHFTAALTCMLRQLHRSDWLCAEAGSRRWGWLCKMRVTWLRRWKPRTATSSLVIDPNWHQFISRHFVCLLPEYRSLRQWPDTCPPSGQAPHPFYSCSFPMTGRGSLTGGGHLTDGAFNRSCKNGGTVNRGQLTERRKIIYLRFCVLQFCNSLFIYAFVTKVGYYFVPLKRESLK